MNKIFIFLIIFLTFVSSVIYSQNETNYCLIIHGGAGDFDSSDFSEDVYEGYINFFEKLLSYGDSLLKEGVKALDVAELCTRKLEDSPMFNAGKGAVVNANGDFELDASIMDGRNLKAGAVAGVSNVKNPISLARMVMDSTSHVLLAGMGAEEFASEIGIEIVDKSYFETPQIIDKYEKIKKSKNGTVGVIVLDKFGDLAAATSTGGMMMKRFGRVGDSPIIGAGTYADNNFAAVSCTGHGEYFLRILAAYNVIALMNYGNLSLDEAASQTILKIEKMGGKGGLIAVDKFGNIAMPFNTKSMFRAYIKSNGAKEILF